METEIFRLYRQGCHGIEHAYRVYSIAKEICLLENINESNSEFLEFCAIFHDIGRINDGLDDHHGQRSLKVLNDHSYFGLKKFNYPLTHFIIENHCLDDHIAIDNVHDYYLINKEESIYLFNIFKDSDSLDRVRLFDLDPSYLRLSNSHKLINFSQELFDSNVDRKMVENVFSTWISSRAEL